MSFAKNLLHPANIVGDIFFKKPKQNQATDLPKSPQYGDPAVRQAEADLRLQQKRGYAGTVLTGNTTQAVDNRAMLAKALGMQPVAPVAPSSPASSPGANWQTWIGSLPIGVNVGNPLP